MISSTSITSTSGVVLMSDMGFSSPPAPPTEIAILSSYPCLPGADGALPAVRPVLSAAAREGPPRSGDQALGAAAAGAAAGLAAGAAVTEGFTAPFELMLASTSVAKPASCSAMRLLRAWR